MPPSQYRFRGSCIPLPVLTAGYGATRVPAGVKARRVAQVPPLSLLAALPRIEALLPFMVSVLPFMVILLLFMVTVLSVLVIVLPFMVALLLFMPAVLSFML